MTDLEELRRVLRAREALAPDAAGIAATARARGARIRRVRIVATAAGTAAAVIAVIAVAAGLLARPQAATRQLPGHDVVTGGWPVVPSYTGPAVPGHPTVPGPTGGLGPLVSGRPIDPVVPYSVALPAGWRESGWQYKEGSFRGTYVEDGNSGIRSIAIDVLDPATQPASLLRPSGDPTTGEPGPDGSLAWRADDRHFLRLQLQGDSPAELFRGIARTIDFDHQRAMVSPFGLGYLPAGLHLAGANIQLSASPANDPGNGYWGVTLVFDAGTGAIRGEHDLTIDFNGEPNPASIPPIAHPITVGGHLASSQPVEDGSTELAVYGVDGQNVYFNIGRSARDRITLDEAGRIVQGIRFVDRPADAATWMPLRLP